MSSRPSCRAYSPAAGLERRAVPQSTWSIAAIGTVFAAGYLLWLLQRVAFGTPKEEFADEHIHDMHLTEYIAWVAAADPASSSSASTRTCSST